MIFGLLKLRKIYEDFNGRREGVNIFDGTEPTIIAYWLGFPYVFGHAEYWIKKLGDSYYLHEAFYDKHSQRSIVERIYAIERRGADLL